jgi:hypothetical protein
MGCGTPGNAHTTREHAELQHLFDGAKTLALTLYRLLDPTGTGVTYPRTHTQIH